MLFVSVTDWEAEGSEDSVQYIPFKIPYDVKHAVNYAQKQARKISVCTSLRSQGGLLLVEVHILR